MLNPLYTYKQFFVWKNQFTISTHFKCQTVLFQTIQFIISTLFSSIRPIDMTLSGATTLGLS